MLGEKHLKKLFKAIMVLTSFSVLTRLMGFLFRIFLSRLVGAEGLGVYQIAFSVFMVLETFISSGLPLIVSKETAKIGNSDRKNEFSVTTSAIILGFITAITINLIVLIFHNVFAKLFTDQRCLTILFILLPTLVFSCVYSVLRGNLWGHKKYFLGAVTEFIEQVIRMTLTILFLGVFNFALEKVFLTSIAYVISCVVSSIIVLIIYLKQGGKFKNPKNNFKLVVKSATPITIVRVLSSLLMPVISVIIPLKLVSIGYTNEQALSILGIAVGMTFPLLYVPSTLTGSLAMTIIPDLSSAIIRADYIEIKKRINFSIKFAIFISFLFIPLYFALGVPIGQFFYNNTQSGIYLSRACMLIVPICVSSITTSCLNALNLEVKGFANYLISAIILFVFVLFLTNYLGIMALTYGMILCLGLASFLNILMLNKKLKDNFFNLIYFLKSILCSLPSILIAKWSFNIFSNIVQLFFSLMFACIFAMVFYLTFGLIFNLYNFSLFEFKKLFNKKVQKNNK